MHIIDNLDQNTDVLADQIFSEAWHELSQKVPDWTTEEAYSNAIFKQSQENSKTIVETLNQISDDEVLAIRQYLELFIENGFNSRSEIYPNILPSLQKNLELTIYGQRFFLSKLFGLELGQVTFIGSGGKKSGFLVESKLGAKVVCRYWNIDWKRYQEIFEFREQPLDELLGESEITFHKVIGTDFSTKSMQLPYIGVDLLEPVILRADFYSYIDFAAKQYSDFRDEVYKSRNANPFGDDKYDDWGLALREKNGKFFATAVHFDFSDPQYLGMDSWKYLEKLRLKSTPHFIPIDKVPKEMREYLFKVNGYSV